MIEILWTHNCWKKMETFLDEWLEKSYGYFVVSVENRPTGLNSDS